MTAAPHDPVRTLLGRPLVTVAVNDSLRAAAEHLSTELVGAGMVGGARPPALLSERDIVVGIAVGADPDTALVDDVTTDYVVTVSPDDSILDAATRMLMNEIRHLPVMEGGEVIGIVSERDLLAVLANAARAHV